MIMYKYNILSPASQIFAAKPLAARFPRWYYSFIFQRLAERSAPRGGTLWCTLEGERVKLAGKAALYSQAEIFVD